MDQVSRDEYRRRILNEFLTYGFTNDDDVLFYVKEFLGVSLPTKTFCSHHQSPAQFLCDMFFERCQTALAWANRTGGKTLTVAILNHMNSLFKGDIEVLGAGAVIDQANKGYQYFQNTFKDPLLAPHLKEALMSRSKTSSGATVSIVAGTKKSLNGPHPQKLSIDEVELMDWDVLQEAFSMSVSKRNVKAQDVLLSTRKFSRGPMQRLIEEAEDHQMKIYSWCAIPGTKIVMGDGTIKSIEKIEIGETVISGSGKIREVTRTWERKYTGKVIELAIQGVPYKLTLTPEHRVITKDGEKRCDQLTVSDMLFDPRNSELSDKTWLDGMILGFYAAEGCLTKRGYGVSFGIHKKEISNRIELLKKWDSSLVVSVYERLNSNTACIEVYNQKLRNFIEGNIVGDSTTKRLLSLPTGIFANGVLTGWLEGDGWISRNGKIGQSSSKQLAWQMFRLATNLGYSTSLRKYKNRGGPQNRTKKVKPAYRVSVMIGTGHHRQPTQDITGIWRSIKKIRSIPYSGPVYDLTVDVDHTFLASGISVNNCIWDVVERCNRKCQDDPIYGNCPIFDKCQGKAHEGNGWYKIDDLIKKTLNMSQNVFEAQWENKRPHESQTVYADYWNETKHAVTWEHLAKVFPDDAESLSQKKIPEHWKRVAGIDFGSVFVFLLLALEPKTRTFVLYHEYYSNVDRLLKDHAARMRAAPGFALLGPIFADAAAKQDRLELKGLGIGTFKSVKEKGEHKGSILLGVDEIKGLLQNQAVLDRPRFYLVKDNCPQTIREFEEWPWELNDDGTPNMDKPLDSDNHCMDALRYAIYSLSRSGGRYDVRYIDGI